MYILHVFLCYFIYYYILYVPIQDACIQNVEFDVRLYGDALLNDASLYLVGPNTMEM